jgi:uncharacterized phage-associated protein
MADVHDVATFILETKGPMTAMRLQKLVYYSQAWSLVWNDRRLFPEPILAWAGGPVVYELYKSHRGQFMVSSLPKGSSSNLTEDEKAVIQAVVDSYGLLDGQALSRLTHGELPWREARGDLPPGERSTREISVETIQEYYQDVDADDEAEDVKDLVTT